MRAVLTFWLSVVASSRFQLRSSFLKIKQTIIWLESILKLFVWSELCDKMIWKLVIRVKSWETREFLEFFTSPLAVSRVILQSVLWIVGKLSRTHWVEIGNAARIFATYSMYTRKTKSGLQTCIAIANIYLGRPRIVLPRQRMDDGIHSLGHLPGP